MVLGILASTPSWPHRVGTGAFPGPKRDVVGRSIQIRPERILTIVGVVAVLAGTALLACLVPAVRAARADPLETLKAE